MLAIDFPGKKRIFIMNSTAREMISDIFFLTNNIIKQAFKNIFFFIFKKIFTNNSIKLVSCIGYRTELSTYAIIF